MGSEYYCQWKRLSGLQKGKNEFHHAAFALFCLFRRTIVIERDKGVSPRFDRGVSRRNDSTQAAKITRLAALAPRLGPSLGSTTHPVPPDGDSDWLPAWMIRDIRSDEERHKLRVFRYNQVSPSLLLTSRNYKTWTGLPFFGGFSGIFLAMRSCCRNGDLHIFN